MPRSELIASAIPLTRNVSSTTSSTPLKLVADAMAILGAPRGGGSVGLAPFLRRGTEEGLPIPFDAVVPDQLLSFDRRQPADKGLRRPRGRRLRLPGFHLDHAISVTHRRVRILSEGGTAE